MDPTVAAVLITSVFGLVGIIYGQKAGTSRRQRAELTTSEAKWRVQQDYNNELRQFCLDHGLIPPPWPPELRSAAATVSDPGGDS